MLFGELRSCRTEQGLLRAEEHLGQGLHSSVFPRRWGQERGRRPPGGQALSPARPRMPGHAATPPLAGGPAARSFSGPKDAAFRLGQAGEGNPGHWETVWATSWAVPRDLSARPASGSVQLQLGGSRTRRLGTGRSSRILAGNGVSVRAADCTRRLQGLECRGSGPVAGPGGACPAGRWLVGQAGREHTAPREDGGLQGGRFKGQAMVVAVAGVRVAESPGWSLAGFSHRTAGTAAPGRRPFR